MAVGLWGFGHHLAAWCEIQAVGYMRLDTRPWAFEGGIGSQDRGRGVEDIGYPCDMHVIDHTIDVE